jgi:tRNA modification GTPase
MDRPHPAGARRGSRRTSTSPKKTCRPKTRADRRPAWPESRQNFPHTPATAKHDGALRAGLRVAVVGAPNAGKSSLLNVLAGAERAIVSPEAGTTRDYLEAPVAGLPLAVTAIDTAGLRDGGSTLENLGMTRSLEQARGAHLLLLVVDASAEPPPCRRISSRCWTRRSSLVVANKSDLPAHPAQKDFLPQLTKLSACLLDGRDAETLRAKLGDFLRRREIAPGAEELVVSVRHAEAMARAAVALTEAVGHLKAPIQTELAAAQPGPLRTPWGDRRTHR